MSLFGSKKKRFSLNTNSSSQNTPNNTNLDSRDILDHRRTHSESEDVVNPSDGLFHFNIDYVNTVYAFWLENLGKLDKGQQNLIGMLIFGIYFQKSDEGRKPFEDFDVNKFSRKLLDNFSWLFCTLKDNNGQLRAKKLKDLGIYHQKLGVKPDFFVYFLQSVNEALEQRFPKTYQLEIKLALTYVYKQVANAMFVNHNTLPFPDENNSNHHNTNSNSNNSITNSDNKVDTYLKSIDHCLYDSHGSRILEEYLKQTLCSELTEFHKYFMLYRSCLNPKVRKTIAFSIMNLFLSSGAEYELNDSGDNRKILNNKIQECETNEQDYPLDLFDDTHTWVKFQISQNRWFKFKKLMENRSSLI